MPPEQLADQLLAHYGRPDFDRQLQTVRPFLTPAVVRLLVEGVSQTKLRHAHRALQMAEVAQAVAQLLDQPEAQARAAWAKGVACYHLSRYREALACFDQADPFYRGQANHLAELGLHVNRLAVLQETAEYQAALDLALRARPLGEALGRPAWPYLAALDMNLGSAYQQLGQPQAALAALGRARALFADLGDLVEVARADVNRANVLEEMHDFEAAERLHQAARQVLQAAGMEQEVARANLNLGSLAYRRGHYPAALSYLELAHQGFAAIPNPVDIAVTNLLRSFVYRRLNLLPETIDLAAEAANTFRQNRMSWQRAWALVNRATACEQLGATQVANRLLAQARQIFRRKGAWARVLALDLERATLAWREGRHRSARQLAGRVERALDSEAWPHLALRCHLLLAQTGRQARPRAEVALVMAEKQGLPAVMEAATVLGDVLDRAGDLTRAWQCYQTAVGAVQQLQATLPVDELRLGFLDDKQTVFEGAIRLAEAMGRPAEVFYLLNLAQSAPLPVAAPLTKGEGRQTEEIYTLREQWQWYQNQLDTPADFYSHTSPAQRPSAVTLLRQQQREVERKLAELLRRRQAELATEDEGQGAVDRDLSTTVRRPPSAVHSSAGEFLAHVEARLGPEDALLQYYVVDGRLHAFLLSIPSSPHPGENVYQVHNLAPAAWLRDTLAAWQAYLENSYLHQHAPQASLTIAQGRLAQFHQALMSPLEKHLAGRQRLFLVLPPEFHPLPVAAFFDGRRYLAERFELVYLSSAAMLMEDEGLPSSVVRSSSSALSPALVVGHSNQGQLPAALLEAQQVGRTLHTQGRAVQLLLEDEARLDQVRQASRACDLLHLASHATFRPDNPFFSWVRLADARLTVADLYEMTLPQRPLVVLSACETGRGRPRGGGLLGMGRGFLAAGAAGVVVSQWKVGDAASAGFMGDFYHSLAGAKGMERDVAHALNQAQRLALSRQPHPYYWAGYIYLRG